MFATPTAQSSNSEFQTNQSNEFGFCRLTPTWEHRLNRQRSTAVSAFPRPSGVPASIPNAKSWKMHSENSFRVENIPPWAIAVLALPRPSKVSRDTLVYQAWNDSIIPLVGPSQRIVVVEGSSPTITISFESRSVVR